MTSTLKEKKLHGVPSLSDRHKANGGNVRRRGRAFFALIHLVVLGYGDSIIEAANACR